MLLIIEFFRLVFFDFANRNSGLFHAVSVANGNHIVFKTLMVNGNAVWRSQCVHSSVSLSDGIFLFVMAVEIEFLTDPLFPWLSPEVRLFAKGAARPLNRSQKRRNS